MEVLGVIPARGGSKGVPGKNIRILGTKPLIAHAIEAARHSRLLTDYVVSTDDDAIAAVAEEWGCEVLRRPARLAADETPMAPVIAHALKEREADQDIRFGALAIIQPTAPLRVAEDIDGAIQALFDQDDADTAVSVYQVEDHHPARMYTRDVSGLLRPVIDEPESCLRQQLPPVYHRNGAVYALRRTLLADQGKVIGESLVPYVMPAERSVNIDTEIDFTFAELLVEREGVGLGRRH